MNGRGGDQGTTVQSSIRVPDRLVEGSNAKEVIQSQAKCIQKLKAETFSVKKQRDDLAALLAHKLQMYSQGHRHHNHGHHGHHHHHHNNSCCQAAAHNASHHCNVNGLGPPAVTTQSATIVCVPHCSVTDRKTSCTPPSVRVSPCPAGVYCHRLRSPPTTSFTCVASGNGGNQLGAGPTTSTPVVVLVSGASASDRPLHRHQHRVSKRSADEDDHLSRCRAAVVAAVCRPYELSQDLQEKQVEMLCRKYGGAMRAHRAARVIQQAYRRYRLSRSFARMRLEASSMTAIQPPSMSNFSERRLTRRFADFGQPIGGVCNSCRGDMVGTDIPPKHGTYFDSADPRVDVAGHEVRIDSFASDYDAASGGRCAAHVSRLCTRVTVRKAHSVNVTTTTRSQRTVVERHVVVQGSATCCGHAGSGGIPIRSEMQSDVLPLQPSVSQIKPVLTHNEDCTSRHLANAKPQPPPRTGIGSLCDSVDQYIDVDDIILNDGGAIATENTFQKLSLTDSSYGDAVHTDDELEDDVTTDDEVSQPAPPAMAHVYSSLRLCNRHVSPAMVTVSGFSDDANGSSERNPSAGGVLRLASGGNPGQAGSPIWKRKEGSLEVVPPGCGWRSHAPDGDGGNFADISHSGGSDTASNGSGGPAVGQHSSNTYSRCSPMVSNAGSRDNLLDCTAPTKTCQRAVTRTSKGSDIQRKRTYRIGLNLFNKKPEKGIRYLVENRFVDYRPNAVARFLITRKGLSKLMIGEFLGNIQKQFNTQVLVCFCDEIDLTGLQVDVALRKFQSYFRMPGEAQKIERLMEAFASRYCECNGELIKHFRRPDTVFLLAFATIMLNTDLHNKSVKAERKMKLVDFIRNLRGIDDGEDIDPELLTGIYERVRTCEFQPSADHVLQVVKVEQMIVGKKPQLALLHRRLVCYCRLYEVQDVTRKEKVGQHQREVFLFNDMIMVTKIVGKRKNSTTYTFRCSFPLYGVSVELFDAPSYKFGLKLVNNANGKVLLMLNARNEHDRDRFVADLKEAILEVSEMETLRIGEELEKQTMQPKLGNVNRYSKDSGVVDIELLRPLDLAAGSGVGGTCEVHDEEIENLLAGSLVSSGEAEHSCSAGSLDSGMVSLHS